MADAICNVIFADGTQCDRPVRYPSSGWCMTCYSWSLKNGRADPNGRRRSRRQGEVKTTLAKAARAETDACILLPSDDGKQARVRYAGGWTVASRAVWMIANGDPGDALVLHRCNGGSGAHGCINIRHLYLGDGPQNMRDMVDGGHSNRGTKHPLARLTAREVCEIRHRWASESITQKELAAQYGIGKDHVYQIVHRTSWAWLDCDSDSITEPSAELHSDRESPSTTA